MTTMAGGRLIDLVNGQISRGSQVGSLDFFNEFVSHRAKRVAALGDFDEMDVGIEIVERGEVRVTGIVGWIHAEEVDRVRPLRRGSGLSDLVIKN
jgi:hypothetical protein